MKDHPVILSFDTAMNVCGAGVYARGHAHARAEPMMAGHGERLIPMIEDVLRTADVHFKDISAVVTTVGPGAFTGLRIGLSSAKAFGLALGVPVIGISTLQVLASQYAAMHADNVLPLAVIIETKRSDFYVQIFSASAQARTEPAAMPAEAIRGLLGEVPHVLIGDGVQRYKGIPAGQSYERVDCGFMARLFALAPEEPFWQRPAEPLYLRGAEVSQSKRVQRVLGP